MTRYCRIERNTTVCQFLLEAINGFILQQKRQWFPRLQRPFSEAGRLPPRVSCSAPFRSSISWPLSPSFSFQRGRRTCHSGIFVFLCLAARSRCTQTETQWPRWIMSLFFPGDVHFLGLDGLLGQGTTAAPRLLLHILPFGFFTLAIAHHFSIRLWELLTHWIMSLIFSSLEIFCAEHKAEQVPERSEGMR